LAEASTQPLIAKWTETLEKLAAASNLAYRLELTPTRSLASSTQAPETKHWPFEQRLQGLSPAPTLRVAPISDVPVQKAAERRRQVYLAMVILAAMVILIALYATWYAVSREVEVAQLKARFVASMSHELKTPLSIIGLIGQKLQLGRYESPAEAQEYYTMLSEETGRLRTLIDDVLDFSRLLENRQPYHKKPIDLVALARDTVERFRQSQHFGTAHLTFQSELPECRTMLDPEAMGRVLLNLLDNAVKYSPADRIHLTVTLRQEGQEALLSVADEGYGIPAEEQTLVFDRFYRGRSASDHQQTKGVGLGLSIVKHILDAHRGRIELQSTLGKGSIFTIRLPMEGPSA
jgi:two-component system, OmpR family, phosphate regulon sensor histidine kinase PhoR